MSALRELLHLDDFTPFAATLRKARGAQDVSLDLAERFARSVDASGAPDACWHWTGYCPPNGNGVFNLPRADGPIKAARLAWILHHRTSVPEGARILPTCGNADCVRPDHLAASPTTRAGARASTPRPARVPTPPVADAAPVDEGATIEELAPLSLRRIASAQFGDSVSAPPVKRSGGSGVRALYVGDPPTAAGVAVPIAIAARQDGLRLEDVLALLAVPGTALITYPSGETTFVAPSGTHAGGSVTEVLLRALTCAGYRRVAA